MFKRVGPNCKMSQKDFDLKLKQKIMSSFRLQIIPTNILYAFHKYDIHVLVEQDIQKVRAVASSEGAIEGATVLLERLLSYNNWFDCLMKVLRDPDVKLDHVADEMEEIAKELSHDTDSVDQLDSMTKSKTEHYERQKSTGALDRTNSAHDSDRETNPEDCVSGYRPTDSATRLKHSHSVDDVRPGSFNNPWSIVDMKAGDTIPFLSGDVECESEEAEDDQSFVVLGKGNFPYDFQPPVMPVENRSNKEKITTSDYQSASEYDSRSRPVYRDGTFSKEMNMSSCCKPDEEGEPEGINAKEIPQEEQRKTHGPEYDFDREDVEQELGEVDGWHTNASEIEVCEKMKNLLSEDGYYALWYWEKRKRPALCATLNGQLYPFIIHKEPGKENKHRTEFFYIYKTDRKESTLGGLVEYHLRNGIRSTTKEGKQLQVSFTYPVRP